MSGQPAAGAADFVVIGSGAGGASAALALAEAGARVTILEEGPWLTTPDFPKDMNGALRTLWRDGGYQAARGRGLTPVLEGCCVGGSTVISGAILHPMPRTVWEEWAQDPSMAEALPWALVQATGAEIDRELGGVAKLEAALPTLPAVARLRSRGLDVSAMRRAAPGCRHTARCLVGCPSGGKWSMERSFIPRAVSAGAKVIAHCRATRIVMQGGRATGVEATISGTGGRARTVLLNANSGVMVACGAIQSPLLLKTSGIRSPALGEFFQAHVGSAVVGMYEGAAADVEGPAMGLEIFDPAGFKLATQAVPAELLMSRLPLVGAPLSDALDRYERLSAWTSSVRSRAKGKVSRSWLGRPSIRFEPAQEDLALVRTAARRMAENFFALGAVKVFPQIHGVPAVLESSGEAAAIDRAALDPRAYPLALSHLFGTCRMGSDPAASVVSPGFNVHGLRNLLVVDASCFPTNLGVNPQSSIMTLARIAARRAVAELGR